MSKWERGCSLPAVDLLKPLSQEFNVSIIELLDGQRYERESIELEKANAILEETTKRQSRIIRRKRLASAIVFLLVLFCFIISGRLLYNQGLLLPLTFVIGVSRE